MTDKKCMTDGGEVTPDHRDIKENGQQKGYVVICPEDRAKGFVRPFRKSYIHVGAKPENPLRDLTTEEKERFPQSDYIKFEEYSDDGAAKGRFWTQKQLDGCGTLTTMADSIAETYARNPYFYSGTFCCGCGTHFPLEEFVWEGTDEVVGS